MSKAVKFFIPKFRDLINREDSKCQTYYHPRPYRNTSVRFRPSPISNFEERAKIVEKCGLNVFAFPADQVSGCDLLSDSGSTCMTMEQWSKLLLGDESYGSNEGYFELLDQISDTFGDSFKQKDFRNPNIFIFHQGRAAENAFFTCIKQELLEPEGKQKRDNLFSKDLNPVLKSRIEYLCSQQKNAFFIIPSNGHFDTTEANIIYNNIVPLNIPCKEHINKIENYPFRGNINIEELESLLLLERERIPLVYITITNNIGGGQPASFDNIKKAREITMKYNIPLFFDACRFAENVWFIQKFENNFKNKDIPKIVKEIFKSVDGFTVSFKKDGLVNMGGGLILNNNSILLKKYPKLQERLINYQIQTEGHTTYGGLAGRDLKGLAEGLRTVVRQDYLDHRVNQVRRLGEKFIEYGIPIIKPAGGHAIYLEVDRFFEGVDNPDEEFRGIALLNLLLIAGHRVSELGIYAFGKHVNGIEFPPNPRANSLRLAIPRLVYEDQDLLSVVEAIKILHEYKDKIPGVEITYGRELPLRLFKSTFKFKD